MKISIDKTKKVHSFEVTFSSQENAPESEFSESKPQDSPALKPDSSFNRIFDDFVDSSEMYLYTNPLVRMMLLSLMMNISNKQIEDFCRSNGSLESEVSNVLIYELPIDKIIDFHPIVKNFRSAGQLLNSTNKNLLIQLSTQFDILVSDLAKTLLESDHALYDTAERQVDVIELLKFESMDSFKIHLLDKATEAVIRKNREDQFRWLEKKIDKPLTKDLSKWSEFVEINERRNLFTHTRGLVTKNYIETCRRLGLNTVGLNVGDEINTNEEYCKNSSKICFVIGVKLIQVIWRVRRPGEAALADDAIISLLYDLNINLKYDISMELGRFFCTKTLKYSSDVNKRKLYVNCAAAYMLSGEIEEAVKLLDELDWSATGVDFQICIAALRKDTERVVQLLPTAIASGLLGETALREWPVFTSVRDDQKFKDSFFREFKKEYIPKSPTRTVTASELSKMVANGSALFRAAVAAK